MKWPTCQPYELFHYPFTNFLGHPSINQQLKNCTFQIPAQKWDPKAPTGYCSYCTCTSSYYGPAQRFLQFYVGSLLGIFKDPLFVGIFPPHSSCWKGILRNLSNFQVAPNFESHPIVTLQNPLGVYPIQPSMSLWVCWFISNISKWFHMVIRLIQCFTTSHFGAPRNHTSFLARTHPEPACWSSLGTSATSFCWGVSFWGWKWSIPSFLEWGPKIFPRPCQSIDSLIECVCVYFGELQGPVTEDDDN